MTLYVQAAQFPHWKDSRELTGIKVQLCFVFILKSILQLKIYMLIFFHCRLITEEKSRIKRYFWKSWKKCSSIPYMTIRYLTFKNNLTKPSLSWSFRERVVLYLGTALTLKCNPSFCFYITLISADLGLPAWGQTVPLVCYHDRNRNRIKLLKCGDHWPNDQQTTEALS